ncbi:MAG: choice-of-anchor tandem repeat GloVer-containing protein [Bryobacteraceae bacterium]
MKRNVNVIGKRNYRTRVSVVFALFAATSIALPAQTFNTIHSFDGTDGALPHAGLIQAGDGNLYGATEGGGAHQQGGTIFQITPSGALTTLYSFCSQSGCTDGENPYEGLVQASSGELYGTTYGGGANHLGTVFKITLSGTLTTLYSFCSQSGCTDGEYPKGALVEAPNGEFYGTTSQGGANDGSGTVFKITPNGTLKTLYSFCAESGCADGKAPGGLVQAADGNFYGTTATGGASERGCCGTVFTITPSGTLTTLHSFCAASSCADGAAPVGGLIQASTGDFYGTTQDAGGDALGTVFKITPGGELTTLHRFCFQKTGCTDGSYPNAGLVQGADGNFYGTTSFGGACAYPSGCGTIFQIAPSGALTTLHSFCSESNCADGEIPAAALVQAANGDLYGTTNFGGAGIDRCSSGNGCGTVFSLSGF